LGSFKVLSFYAAWRWYLRGNIVSWHAARLITQFMAACCGRSTTREQLEADPDALADGTGQNVSNTISLLCIKSMLPWIVLRAAREDHQ
jgi:hypothetical protein